MLKKTLFIILILQIAYSYAAALGETRALWITRWEYKTKKDIENICRNAAEANFNVLLFQVRGNGTVNYPSEFEPWSEQIGGQNPGFDPLDYAIKSAHRHDLECHAWVNVYPGWSGKTPPTDKHQLYNLHRDYFMVDRYGVRQPLSSGYVWLSPTQPQVQHYLFQLFREIYIKYPIDGLHLDYIRYPGVNFSYDPVSLDLFQQKFNTTPEERPATWRIWRREAITDLVSKIYTDLKNERPDAVLSASVVSDYHRGSRVFLQDSHAWVAKGIIDVLYPMIYTNDDSLFKRLLAHHLENSHNRFICPGILNNSARIQEQIDIARDLDSPGFALFSYSQLFPEHRKSELVDKLFSSETIPATMPWKNYSGDNQGPFISQVKTVPLASQPGVKFKIAAKISDPSGVYDDNSGPEGKGVYLQYGTNQSSLQDNIVKMSRIKKTQDWFISDNYIPAQPEGVEFQCRIYAHDNYHISAKRPKRNKGHSDIISLSILNPNESYVSVGEVGPSLWNPDAIILDAQDNIWTRTAIGGPVLVFDANGSELPFSPVRYGMTDNQKVPLLQIAGFAQGPDNSMYIATNHNIPSIYQFDCHSGQALGGFQVGFQIQEISTDSNGHLFILEKSSTRWHIFNGNGDELKGSPFGGGRTGMDLAVLKNAAAVFISDKTHNSIQCWHGAIENDKAMYWLDKDISTSKMGLGKITVDESNYVYMSQSQNGIITVLNALGEPIERLSGGTPPVHSPRQVAVTQNRNILYLLQVSGVGPIKVQKWVKKIASAQK